MQVLDFSYHQAFSNFDHFQYTRWNRRRRIITKCLLNEHTHQNVFDTTIRSEKSSSNAFFWYEEIYNLDMKRASLVLSKHSQMLLFLPHHFSLAYMHLLPHTNETREPIKNVRTKLLSIYFIFFNLINVIKHNCLFIQNCSTLPISTLACHVEFCSTKLSGKNTTKISWKKKKF